MTAHAADFYQQVINQVIEDMRNEFIQDGVSEDVLEKLKKLWETKLKEKTVDAQTYRSVTPDNSLVPVGGRPFQSPMQMP